MNILHLLSQNHLTGAEVYAVTLAEKQIDEQHRVYQVSNGFFYNSPAIKLNMSVETKSKITFIKNVLWLRNFIRKQNIHVIHTHSRAAAKLGYWATLGTTTALVSTVHGVQHPSFSKKIHNQYGKFIIAVCENIKTQLQRDFSYSAEFIKVLPNPVKPGVYRFIEKNKPALKKIAVVGRTTGPKATRTEQVLKVLAQDLGYEISLLGGQLSQLNLEAQIKLRVTEIKAPQLSSEIYSQYDLIIGSGRVAIEALITGVPTIAFGEACYMGPVTAENFYTALQCNFGDIHPDSKEPQLNEAQFKLDLKTSFADLKTISDMAQAEFSLDVIGGKIQRLYESAYFLKNHSAWIPALMYHKIPKADIKSQHKIYVTEENFEKHLQFFKKSGFETLTFSDLEKFRTGERSFTEFPVKPLLLTFDDGYRDNLENASPLLKKYNYRAQLFLLADNKIQNNKWDLGSDEPAHEIISGAERQRWLSSQFEIGSHGFSHRKITDFNTEDALTELRESKKSLEDEFNIPINVYAFTYGITSANSAELAEKAGYSYAVNTDTGGLILEEQPYAIFRVNIFPDESRWSLFKKTSTWYRRYFYFKRKK